MKTLIALLAVAVVVTVACNNTPVTAASESSFDRSLPVSGSVALSLSTGSGDVHVQAGSDSQVHVVARVRANNNAFRNGNDVEARIQQIAANPPIRQVGNTINVGPEHDDPLYRNISISYEVTTPKQTTLTAKSGSGSVRVADLLQDLNAQTGSGDVQAENIGAKVRMQSGSGSVRAHNIHGNADLQTGSGDIELQATDANIVRAQTGSGSIRLNGVSGDLNAQTGSGDITADGQISSSGWRMHTGSGSVNANLGSSAHFTLNASTGSGSIHMQQPITMQGSINQHHLNGTVNGGGPELNVQTGSGDIRIQ